MHSVVAMGEVVMAQALVSLKAITMPTSSAILL